MLYSSQIDVYKRQAINRATTTKILEIIKNKYITEIGKPYTIITDHGTQFKGRKWRDELLKLNINKYSNINTVTKSTFMYEY